MARNRRDHSRQPRGRLGRIIAGAGFVVTAVGWLIFNEQRRRTNVAIQQAVTRISPRSRARLQRLWRWWQLHWRDPWGANRAQLVGSAAGDVLEVGVGRWPNLRRYRQAQRLVGVEPNRRGVLLVRRRIRRFRPTAEIVYAAPEALPFADASFDVVVASLALCTVRDQAATLREIARVLRPQGTLRFLEHVHSPHPIVARVQSLFTPIWRLVADGCHLDRDTLAAIRAAGFVIGALELIQAGWPLSRPTYMGTARPPILPQSTKLTQQSEALSDTPRLKTEACASTPGSDQPESRKRLRYQRMYRHRRMAP